MILPAIIPHSFDHLRETLEKISFAESIQIDVVDGDFNKNVSWPYEPAGKVTDARHLLAPYDVEVDLMVSDPISAGREWLSVGAKALVFHIEGLSNPKEASALRLETNFKLGWALSNDTPLTNLYPMIEDADFVQLMGIAEIGSQGQPFNNRVLDRIVTLRALYPELVISIDGGVSKETIPLLKDVGANRFIAGSAILKSDSPEETYKELLKIS